MKKLKYSCTALVGTNKKGILEPDEHGYYYLCLGAMNIHNSQGIWYDWETSKSILGRSATFRRKAEKAALMSEEEHPDWEAGWSLEQYISRIRIFDKDRVCAFIRDVEIVQGEKVGGGKHRMYFYAWVKPWGARGEHLKAALDDPHQNVYFSLRALCDDNWVGGQCVRTLVEFVTFDWVSEGGLHVASKYHSPALESHDIDVPVSVLQNIVDKRGSETQCIGLESEDYDNIQRVIDYAKNSEQGVVSKPKFLKW
jgi:hypothetical protein